MWRRATSRPQSKPNRTAPCHITTSGWPFTDSAPIQRPRPTSRRRANWRRTTPPLPAHMSIAITCVQEGTGTPTPTVAASGAARATGTNPAHPPQPPGRLRGPGRSLRGLHSVSLRDSSIRFHCHDLSFCAASMGNLVGGSVSQPSPLRVLSNSTRSDFSCSDKFRTRTSGSRCGFLMPP